MNPTPITYQNLPKNPVTVLPFSATHSLFADMPAPLPPPLPKLKQHFNQLLHNKPTLRAGFFHLNAWDSQWIIWFNQFSHRSSVATFFKIISRLGDGWLWALVTMGAGLYLWMTRGFIDSFFAIYTCLMTSSVGYTIYKYLKTHTVRPRPYQVHQVIRLGERPLDVFSFPSGHTLQAVIFSMTLCHFLPVLGWFLLPFTLLVAISRMILGLHYPTDVAMGALLGGILAKVGLVVGGKITGL